MPPEDNLDETIDDQEEIEEEDDLEVDDDDDNLPSEEEVDEFISEHEELDSDLYDDDIDDDLDEEDDLTDEEAIDDLEQDEEDDTDEDIDDKEESRLLDELLEHDPNAINPDDEEEEEEIPDDITDEMIANAMYTDPDYARYLEQAENDGVDIKDNFAALLARNRINPEFVMERGLYSLADFQTLITSLEEKSDPNAIMVPREDDEEGWKTFERDVLNVPEGPEGFKDDIFDHTFLKDSEEEKNNIREFFHNIRLSEEQAYSVTDFLNSEREAFLRQGEEEDMNYKKDNIQELKDTFEDDFDAVKKQTNTFLHKYGKGLLKEFKGSKVLYSKELTMMIYNAMNDIATPETVSFKGHHMNLSIISDEKLDTVYEKLLEHKYADESYLKHRNPDIRKLAKKVALRLRAVDSERERRGLND